MHLIRHPDSVCDAVHGIEVRAERGPAGRLVLEYRTNGLPAFPIPETTAKSVRADALWEHTCFEAFVRPAGGEAYYEFNFSPGRRWAAYRLGGYRLDRRDADVARPVMAVMVTGDSIELRAELDLSGLAETAGDWRAGFSAVIEDTDGRLSYWALKHPPGRADFHHGDGFALELPAICGP